MTNDILTGPIERLMELAGTWAKAAALVGSDGFTSGEDASSAEDEETAAENALETALRELLGKPVAWQYRYITDEGPSEFWHSASKEEVDALKRRTDIQVRALYAPRGIVMP